MNQILTRIALSRALLALTALCLPAQHAAADSREIAPTNAKLNAECGGCHVAYAPRLLPAPAWRRIMAGLERHFGTDASLDAASAGEIGAYLQANAAQDKKRGVDSGTLRITETAWFKQQHAELVPTVWTHKLVKTPVNCGACHAAAERGDFGQHRNWFRTRTSRIYAAAGLGNGSF